MAVEINQLVGYAERRVDGEEESGAGFADGHCDDDARLRPSSWARRERFRRVRRKMGAVLVATILSGRPGPDFRASFLKSWAISGNEKLRESWAI